jgi:hypothetical protein
MIANTWIHRVIGPVLFGAAVTALVAGSGLARAKDEPKNPEKAAQELSKVTKDDLTSKIPNFFYFDYPYTPKLGKRLWLRVDDKHWIERYPDGMESKYKILGRTKVREESGTVVVKIEGDPEKTQTDNEGKFQVFVPDKGNKEPAILFRRLGEGDSEWRDMSWSDNKKTLIQKVE